MEFVWELLNKPFLNLGGSGVALRGLLESIAIFVLGFYLGKYYKKRIEILADKRFNLTVENRTIVSNLGYYAIIIITILMAVSFLGVNLTSLAIVAGAISVGIGFGLQNIVSNFVSGLILMFEKSVRVGDIVKLSTGELGRIRLIQLRATTITTFDNIDIIVPNSTFLSQNIINYTHDDSIRRISIPFGVAYGSDVDRVKQTILGSIFADENLNFLRDNPDRKPDVRMTALADSALNFVLIVWIDTANPDRPASFDFHFLPVIYNALNRAGIGIPFPQMDLHLKRG